MTQGADETLNRTVGLLEQLVAFDTESSKSNWPIIHFIADYLRAREVPFVIVPNPTGDKAALFATIGPMQDGGIILSGHTDVVPVAGQLWTSDPFKMRREGTRLYGRGTTDMKGFDATALAMVDELRAANLKTPVHILLSYDEETTCLGPVDTIGRFGKDLPMPRIAIVGEPTQMQVADAHKAVATYRTSVYGLEAHSSKPHLGANAIEGAAALVHALYGMARDLAAAPEPAGRFDPPFSTLSVGVINGGTARNILARECSFQWEFRPLPGAPIDLARKYLDAFATASVLPQLTRYAPQARIETVTEIEVPGLAAEPGSAAQTLALKLTRSNHTIAVSFATEGGRFQAGGISTIICGPGSIDQAHQPDEYIEIAELEACIAFMRRLVDHCG